MLETYTKQLLKVKLINTVLIGSLSQQREELSYCRESRPLHLSVNGRQMTSIHSVT